MRAGERKVREVRVVVLSALLVTKENKVVVGHEGTYLDGCMSSYICTMSTNVLYLCLFSALGLGRVCMFCTGCPINDVAPSILVRTPPFAAGGK